MLDLAMDLLEDAGIPPPPPPVNLTVAREELAKVAMVQRQVGYLYAFVGGMVGGAALSWAFGYGDLVIQFGKWVLSSTGIAVLFSVLNAQRLTSFRCPRCDQPFFAGVGAPWLIFSKQCGNCGLPLDIKDDAANEFLEDLVGNDEAAKRPAEPGAQPGSNPQ